MASALTPALREGLEKLVTSRLGLHFPQERSTELDRGISAAARELGFPSSAAFIEGLLSSPPRRDHVEVLASNLTVGETYFFRDPNTFNALEQAVLPELIRRRQETRRLRIWSAGCATGEEPYSLAILLHKLIPDRKLWHITILATDINSRFLKKAAGAAYGEWSFRDTPSWLKERYFTKTGEGRFELLPEIRSMVTFSHHNLAEDPYPSILNNTNAMCLILCRNVLMYFTPEAATRTIRALRRSLVDGGSLIVGPCELSTALIDEFSAMTVPAVPIYVKRDSAASKPADVIQPRGFEQSSVASKVPAPNRRPLPEPAGVPPPGLPTNASGPPRSRTPVSDPLAEARRLYESGLYQDAEGKILSRMRSGRNDAEAMALLARIYANQGNLALAADWSEKAIAADKLNSGNHYLHAVVLEEQGRVEEAAESLNRALYADPNFILAHFSLGNLLRRLGRTRESRKCLRNALSLLRGCGREDVLAGSEGLTAGRLVEIILSTSGKDDGDEG